MHRIFWAFASFWLAFPALAADDCAPVDLRAQLGPPLHQGDTGFCFAHSSADLITAKLGFRVSPMQLAMNFVLANPEELTGATDPEVLRRLTPEFIAAWRADRNDEPENFAPDTILTENGLLYTGGEEPPTIFVANFLGLCPESRLPTGEKVYADYLPEIVHYHERREREGRIPDREWRAPIGEVREPSARTRAWSFRHWVNERCGAPVLPASPLMPELLSFARDLKAFRHLLDSGELRMEKARDAVMRAVNRALDRGVPVAVGYSANDLMPADPRFPSGDHSSVFAARRRVGKDCLYFLRNSYGEAVPEDYLPKFHDRLERADGGVWVRAQELKSLYSAVWLR